MTNPPVPPASDQGSPTTNSTRERASYPISSTPVGSATYGFPAPGVAGPDPRRGARVRADEAGGGPHPEEETPEPCHASNCTHTDSVPPPPRRNRARKKPADKRVHMIASRFSDDEKKRLLAAAEACSMTPSGFLAHAALAAARDLSRTAAEVAEEREMLTELFALRRHLGHIGNNLNQVAKTLNSGADAPQTEAVLQAVRRAARRIEEFTQQQVRQAGPT
ncbi:plasmid mobilization relaxosome protein MobC [Streptomyces sp. SID5473]|uniref:Plasmid mobilization relaxosome protein MobC n=2 Tax=Streptomyces TaxID=1883 RepID=A0A7G3UAC0_STRT9|nr:plasmid mobilization relaxosome protein MobC [Streptomyces sp. SID5473]QKM66948.1 plasmid mobilization relaxosome protein MobC [Streptomyces tsukubensis NRRL18488]TAI41575.1 MobC family plasmid mobilization relaxosome protein [Streptomyces tsukubensis]